MVDARAHIEKVEYVASRKPSRRDQRGLASRLRCLGDYRLDPTQAQEAHIVPAIALPAPVRALPASH